VDREREKRLLERLLEWREREGSCIDRDESYIDRLGSRRDRQGSL
jgi:hypothetical protein